MKNKKVYLGIGLALLIAGLVTFLIVKKVRKDKLEKAAREHQLFVEKQINNEMVGIQEKVLSEDKNRWIEVSRGEKSYKILAERSEDIELPETEYLSMNRLIDGNKETITYSSDVVEEPMIIEIEYYDAPKLSILIDDVGMNTHLADNFSKIDEEISFATLPFLAKSKEATIKLREMGYEVMLHMPMAGSDDYQNRNTKGILLPSMTKQEIYKRFDKALADVGEVDGYNNHMGSRFTSNEKKMRELIEYTKEKGMYYIDSNTAIKNKGYPVSLELGVPTYYCSHFIDNSKKVDDIKKEIVRSVKLAKYKGKMLVIGHYHKNTAKAIEEMIPYINEQGVRLVFSSKLLEVKED